MRRTPGALASLAIALALTAIPTGLNAEEAETWRYQCLGDEAAGTNICTTELATFEDGEEFIVYFVHTGKGKPPLVVSGENEAIDNVTVAVDKNDSHQSSDCDSGACVFGAQASETLMTEFRKGFRAKVTVRTKGGPIVFQRQLSLRGFTAALTAPPG